MAVNGFLVDNEVQKYNYESLENYNTPDFSTSSIYQVGDYVMYQGKLYRCITEITSSGGWDSSKWSLAILSDDVADLKNSVESGEYGLSEPVKQAILQIARKVAYVDTQGQTYYDDLYDALYSLNVSSISAVYTQSGTVYTTDTLDSLKADLVVTAHYSDSSTAVVPEADYTLSGTLAEGTQTITVSYGGKTTTFDVTVTEYVDTAIHRWDFTQSLNDLVGDGVVTLSQSGASQDSSGLHITTSGGYCAFSNLNLQAPTNITFEIDISAMDRRGTDHGRLLMITPSSGYDSGNGVIYRNSGYWATYIGSWSSSSGVTNPNEFAGKTLKMKYDASNKTMKLYEDDTLILTSSHLGMISETKWQIGSAAKSFYNLTVTGLRIYEGVE